MPAMLNNPGPDFDPKLGAGTVGIARSTYGNATAAAASHPFEPMMLTFNYVLLVLYVSMTAS